MRIISEMKALIFTLKVLFLVEISGSDYTSWDKSTYDPSVCVCSPVGDCSYAGDTPNTDGEGIIEARIAANGANPTDNLGTNSTICQPVSTGIPIVASPMKSCEDGLELCCPSIGYSCGIRYPPVEGSPLPTGEQAPYGAYPYQAVILTPFNLYVSSAVLIDQYHVLTVAHKVHNLSSGAKVRLGDWDAAYSYEPLEPIEMNVTIYIHPNFTLASLRNDIAILRLNSMVPLGQYPTIGTVCLPNTTLSDMRCWVSGWGKNATGKNGRYQRIIKQVDVPLVDSSVCLKLLRASILGSNFVLDGISFLCAGGEIGKDACTGDGGAPLSCFVGDRFYLLGLVSWGLNCGMSKVPGVYVNIQSYIPWIQNMTKMLSSPGFSTSTTKTTTISKPASTSSTKNPSTEKTSTVTVKKLVTTTAATKIPTTSKKITTTTVHTASKSSTHKISSQTTTTDKKTANPTTQSTHGTTKTTSKMTTKLTTKGSIGTTKSTTTTKMTTNKSTATTVHAK